MDLIKYEETAAQLRTRIAELENTVRLQALEIQELNKRVERTKKGYVINPSTPFPLLDVTQVDLRKVLDKLTPIGYTRLFQANKEMYSMVEEVHSSLHKKAGKDITFKAITHKGKVFWKVDDQLISTEAEEQFRDGFCKNRSSFHFRNIIFVGSETSQVPFEQLIESAQMIARCLGYCNITCDTLNTNRIAPLQEMFDALKPNYYRGNGTVSGCLFFDNLSVKGVEHLSLGHFLAPEDVYAALDEKVFEDCHDIHIELTKATTEETLRRVCHFMQRLQKSKKPKSLRGIGQYPANLDVAGCFPNTVAFSSSKDNDRVWTWFFLLRAEPGAVVMCISYGSSPFLQLICKYCKTWEDFSTHFRGKTNYREEDIKRQFFV